MKKSDLFYHPPPCFECLCVPICRNKSSLKAVTQCHMLMDWMRNGHVPHITSIIEKRIYNREKFYEISYKFTL